MSLVSCIISFVAYFLSDNRNAGGLTPVHAAAACGHCDILHQLLMGGGDPYQKDNNGKDAFAWAVPTARNILYMHLSKIYNIC